jgi:putative MFS transporter
MLGYFIGSLMGGFVGDYLGRRKAFRINLLIVGLPPPLPPFLRTCTGLFSCAV